MQAIRDMMGSERAVLVLVLVAAVTVLCGMGYATFEQWQGTVEVFGVGFLASKTVTGAVEAHASGKVASATLAAPAPPTPGAP